MRGRHGGSDAGSRHYSITKGQAAIIAFTRAMGDRTGNLPPMPGVFPDYAAPVVRNAPDGVRERFLKRKGFLCRKRQPLLDGFGGCEMASG